MTEAHVNPVIPMVREDRMPHIWCPGCGIGTTVNCFTRALTESGQDLDKVSIVSGIGCTGRVAGYLNLDSFHTTHGRAIPFATGLALANPELRVVVYSGDGDLTAIGGNHLIHALRRNVNLNILLFNNRVYGLTKGQFSPTSEVGKVTKSTPFGSIDPPFNPLSVALGAEASFVRQHATRHAHLDRRHDRRAGEAADGGARREGVAEDHGDRAGHLFVEDHQDGDGE